MPSSSDPCRARIDASGGTSPGRANPRLRSKRPPLIERRGTNPRTGDGDEHFRRSARACAAPRDPPVVPPFSISAGWLRAAFGTASFVIDGTSSQSSIDSPIRIDRPPSRRTGFATPGEDLRRDGGWQAGDLFSSVLWPFHGQSHAREDPLRCHRGSGGGGHLIRAIAGSDGSIGTIPPRGTFVTGMRRTPSSTYTTPRDPWLRRPW